MRDGRTHAHTQARTTQKQYALINGLFWNLYDTWPLIKYRFRLKRKLCVDFDRRYRPWKIWKMEKIWFLLISEWIIEILVNGFLWNFVCYFAIDKIQIEFRNEDNASIWQDVMTSNRCDWISLKFIFHMTSNKTQVRLYANLARSIFA